jgi:hypothetical protein
MTVMRGPEDRFPGFFVGDLPIEERRAIGNCEAALREATEYINQFRADLSLFDNCTAALDQDHNLPTQTINLYEDWVRLAGRDGAMTIYHFASSLSGVNAWANQSPSLRNVMNKSKIKEGFRLLNEYFPDYAKMRHAVAHEADVTKSSKWQKENVASGPYKGPGINIEGDSTTYVIKGLFQNRTYTATFDGKIRTYELSVETWEKMVSIKRSFYSAFRTHEGQPLPLLQPA